MIFTFISMVWFIEWESLTIEYRKLSQAERKRKLAEFWSKK